MGSMGPFQYPHLVSFRSWSMDQTYPDLTIGKETASAEGVVCLWAARGARGRNLRPRTCHTCAEPIVDWVSTEWRNIPTRRFQSAFTRLHAYSEGLRRPTATINVSCLKKPEQ